MGNAHVSKHHLEGSLADASLEKILASCHKHLLTGLVRVTAGPRTGEIELRAGAVESAAFDGATGNLALARMHALYEGTYEIVQRLPDLAGGLGGAATAEGEVSGVPLIKAMQHCEDNALTCVVTVIAGFDRAQIRYRLGEIVGIEKNGVADEDAIVEILKWPDARFRIEAPPLELDIEARPREKADPSRPFVLKDADKAPGGGAPVVSPVEAPPVEITAEPPPVEPAPVETAPVEPPPVEPPPAEQAPVEPAPVEPPPAEPAPVEPPPVEPAPIEVVTAEPPPAESAPAEPAPAEPAPEEPAITEPPVARPRSTGWWLVTVLVVLLVVAGTAAGVWLATRDRGQPPASSPAPEPVTVPPVDAAPALPVDAAPPAPLDAAPLDAVPAAGPLDAAPAAGPLDAAPAAGPLDAAPAAAPPVDAASAPPPG